jgi:hypothetical protein
VHAGPGPIRAGVDTETNLFGTHQHVGRPAPHRQFECASHPTCLHHAAQDHRLANEADQGDVVGLTVQRRPIVYLHQPTPT